MDFYGIGAALKAAFRMYQQSARQSGRTTSLLESLQDGDRVICLHERDARALERTFWALCRQRGMPSPLKVEFLAYSLPGVIFLHEKSTPKGRTIFTHEWVEAYYEDVISNAVERIGYMQRELSGPGMAHVETEMKAQALRRWSN